MSYKKKERQISRDSPSTIEKERRKPGRKPGQGVIFYLDYNTDVTFLLLVLE